MRPAVALLAVLTGGLSIAFADPPETPATPKPESTAAQSANAQATGQNSVAPAAPEPATAAAVQTPAAASVRPAPSASDERMAQQQLRMQGYRPSMVNGEELYCRREAPLGSRLESVRHCVTLAEAELMAKEGKETTERLQRNTPGCLNPAQGGCGK